MKGIDHLVLCGRDLVAMREQYAALGFILTPPARHPFGTGNSLIQLDSVFLELLGIVEPKDIPEHRPGHFSFAAFNRDFLAHDEGFSMLVLDSEDARLDVAAYRERGLTTYEPFDFRRKARLPSGDEATVGFSLAFATSPLMPKAGFFCCQQHAPQYFWQSQYQTHPNGAKTVSEVALVAETPIELQPFLEAFSGCSAEISGDELWVKTRRGTIAVLTPRSYASRYGFDPPRLDKGPRFAGFTVATAKSPAPRSELLFGTAVRFAETAD